MWVKECAIKFQVFGLEYPEHLDSFKVEWYHFREREEEDKMRIPKLG